MKYKSHFSYWSAELQNTVNLGYADCGVVANLGVMKGAAVKQSCSTKCKDMLEFQQLEDL